MSRFLVPSFIFVDTQYLPCCFLPCMVFFLHIFFFGVGNERAVCIFFSFSFPFFPFRPISSGLSRPRRLNKRAGLIVMLEPNLRIWSMEKSGYVYFYFYFYVHSRVCVVVSLGLVWIFCFVFSWRQRGEMQTCFSLRYNLYLPLPSFPPFSPSRILSILPVSSSGVGWGGWPSVSFISSFHSFIRSIGFGFSFSFSSFRFLSFYLFFLLFLFFFRLPLSCSSVHTILRDRRDVRDAIEAGGCGGGGCALYFYGAFGSQDVNINDPMNYFTYLKIRAARIQE